MRRWLLLALLALGVLAVIALGGARDEGERLGEMISNGAQQLTYSNDDEAVLRYVPRSGINQHYWVSVGAGRRCPERPCPGSELSWLTVHTEGRDSGADYSYQRYVSVPRPLKVMKVRAPVEIVLRKNGDDVELVELR
jgi:hypothetical protein